MKIFKVTKVPNHSIIKEYFNFFLIAVFCVLSTTAFSQGQPVTTIYGDEDGYNTSSSIARDTIRSSSNLVGFTVGGTTYSTGVNDALLTSNSVTFTPAVFQAFPVPDNVSYNSTELVGIGYKWGGVNQTNTATDYIRTFSPVVPAFFIRDGINGLQIATNFFNIRRQNFLYENMAITSIASINDDIPDIIATQTGQPSGSDTFSFVDTSGNVVGNAVTVNFSSSSIPVVGGVDWTIYRVNPASGTVTGTFDINSYRDLRVLSFKLSDFGITASNASQIDRFLHVTSGNTDIAFTAYNKSTFVVNPVDLSVNKTVDKATPRKGDTVIFTITVTNNSVDDASGVIVKDVLPTNMVYDASNSTIPTGTTYDSSTGIWDLSALTFTGGQSVIIEIAAIINEAKVLKVNEVEIRTHGQTDPDSTPNSGN